MTDDDPRNECIPSAPTVGFSPSEQECAARLAFIERRNVGIQQGGADRALEAADGDSIGAAKKAKR